MWQLTWLAILAENMVMDVKWHTFDWLNNFVISFSFNEIYSDSLLTCLSPFKIDNKYYAVADPGFPRREFIKNCKKMKEIEPRGRVHIPSNPLGSANATYFNNLNMDSD